METFDTITIERVIDAPRKRVWRAWIDPEDLCGWFNAGQGWTTPSAQVDVRPGGEFHIAFKGPEPGQGFDFGGTYREVVEPDRLVMVIGDGRPVTVTFEEAEGGKKTKLTLVLALEKVNAEEKQREGWTAMVENLSKHLTK
jgi:uncharacterized protein YndB with AHSA1/START domain